MPPFVNFPSGFECQVCLEHDDSGKAHVIDDSPVCHACISDMHVIWAAKALNIDDFEYILGADFAARYRRREVEYSAPFSDRIYCQSKIRAADKPPTGACTTGCIALQEDETDRCRREGVEVIDCGACVSVRIQRAGTQLTCYHCGGHTTSTGATKTVVDLEKEGQVRGKDFQLCANPTCSIPIQLHDGCNSIRCIRCGTFVCFICGKEVESNNHFLAGACPRFGLPGGNTIHDPEPEPGLLVNIENPAQDLQVTLDLGAELLGLLAAAIMDEVAARELQPEDTPDDLALMREMFTFVNTNPTAAREFVEGMEDLVPSNIQPRLGLVLLSLPELFAQQHERLHGTGERAIFEDDWAPHNGHAFLFIRDHLLLSAAIAAIGEQRLTTELPHLSRGWDQYRAQFPDGLTAQWEHQFVQANRNVVEDD